ncbi:MAG: PIG-L family deacetylase, partial [Acidobacteria bacterium]|nr:PIG-L family deacetylase [Acidobacteriota bacterium]
MRLLRLLFLIPSLIIADDSRRILVVTASSADYIYGAGGTLAQYIEDGWRVDVAIFANEEKMAQGLTPPQTRLVNMNEARAAAKQLGVTDVILMDLKSGELGHVSSTEMRNQLFALIRGTKPRLLFIPDPYVHYQDDQDTIFTGNMAEEAWGYSGGGTFGNELTRMGLTPYGAPEIFYYSGYRPYRSNEGGETERAKLVHRNIASKLEIKIHSAELLHNRNRTWLALRGRPAEGAAARRHARAFITELAATIGTKHGLPYAEEFNHVAPPAPPKAPAPFTKRQETTTGNVLVITPSMRDVLFAAGGTLARMAAEGRAIFIAVFTNEEKLSVKQGPAETRIANNAEGERAAKLLGVREVINLGHKSGELGMLSSSELRNQVMALTRLYKPEILFFPDWYVHYQDDNDLYRTGHMAEESPYGGSSLFLQEMSYLGFPGAAARQYYFFVPYRPYRKREGGEGPAVMKQTDIEGLLAKKIEAIQQLKTANAAWAADLSARSGRRLDPEALVREFLTELAETTAKPHNLRY